MNSIIPTRLLPAPNIEHIIRRKDYKLTPLLEKKTTGQGSRKEVKSFDLLFISVYKNSTRNVT